MIMKKTLLLIFFIAVGAASNIFAQSLAGYKICINPGHGGHDSDDRFIPETGFWESDGNLAKGLYLKSMLENLGATVFITRTANNTSDDLPLSQIVAFANSNNVDYFHSIHSNATGTTTKANYTLILFQGKTTVPTYPGSLTMANFLVDNINKTDRTTSKMVAGDFDFYGTGQAYLGVFKGLNMPGTLSEGSFHDYIPESWRLKNENYLKHEAWGIARSFLQYFKGGTFKDGIVAGIVRDLLEFVPSSYSPITSKGDNYKPINNIKVKLEPGGRICAGDNFNNGYYFFDGVTPGNYKLIFEVDKMRPDTASVTVTANESVFSDRLLTLNPILDPPKILSYSPADSINEVSNISPIDVAFDIRMNPAETQNAFSITPAVNGNFKWDTDYKKMTFTPSGSYQPGGKYVVKISGAAKTHFGINLPQVKVFRFTTRAKLNLVSIYPKPGDQNISTTVLLRIAFDNGLNGTTLAQKISFTDSSGNSVGVSVNQAKYSSGIIEFEPRTPLNNNSLYKLTVREGIGDVESVYFQQTANIEFRTEKRLTYTGNVIENFETASNWLLPSNSSFTKGIDVNQTTFSILNTKPVTGSYSGRLDYTFTGKDGAVDIALAKPIQLGDNSSSEFGVWVFGDASNNVLEYRFSRTSSSDIKAQIDTLTWTGWRFKKIYLTNLQGTGTIQFKSITVTQSSKGSLNGRIYFDDCMSNVITDINRTNNLPAKFLLEQNYPNPFNPSTFIKYQVPSLQHVTLKVFDILGKEIITLVDEIQEPGVYQTQLSAKDINLTSGIYFYRLQSGNFISTKKMMLIK